MLGKLMKYELKATSRLLVPLYLILLIMSVINRIVFVPKDFAAPGIAIIDQFLLIAFVTTIIAVFIATFIYMISRFYKNLLTDEGYLMFTLPAKAHQLIDSKLLITLLWTILSIIVVLLSLFIAFARPDTIPSVINGIRDATTDINSQLGGSWVLIFIELLIMALLSLVSSILMIYVSIAVGQLFSRHKIIASFGAYMVINMALQLLMTIAGIPIAIYISNRPMTAPPVSPSLQLVLPIMMVILLAECACFYLGTNYIFKRKLNLD